MTEPTREEKIIADFLDVLREYGNFIKLDIPDLIGTDENAVASFFRNTLTAYGEAMREEGIKSALVGREGMPSPAEARAIGREEGRTSLKAELLEEVEGMKRKIDYSLPTTDICHSDHDMERKYNTALDDITNLIKEK